MRLGAQGAPWLSVLSMRARYAEEMGSVPKVGFKVGCSADVARGAHPIVRPGCSNPSLERGRGGDLPTCLIHDPKVMRRKGIRRKKECATENGGQKRKPAKRESVWFGETVKVGQVRSVTAHDGQMPGRTMRRSICLGVYSRCRGSRLFLIDCSPGCGVPCLSPWAGACAAGNRRER
jgi:hypothetical protein